jgi:isopentenyl phosphate kinase
MGRGGKKATKRKKMIVAKDLAAKGTKAVTGGMEYKLKEVLISGVIQNGNPSAPAR